MSTLSRRDLLKRTVEAGLALSVIGSGLYGFRALSATYPNSDLLVTAQWLQERVDETSKVRIVDARGPLKYRFQHIPNSVNLWDADVNTWTQGFPRLVASPEQLQPLLERAAMDRDMTIVLYDDEQSRWAGRLFWILEYYQFQNVKLLDGGLAAWTAVGGRLTNETPSLTPSKLNLRADAKKIVTGDWLLEHLPDPSIQIIDSRTAQEYAMGYGSGHSHGEHIGHIPGALLVPAEKALELNGYFKKANELRLLYRNIGPSRTILTYSETGVRAALAYFQLRLLGYSDVRVYDASWAEWGSDEKFPVATGGVVANGDRHTSTCW
ncbi:sulfurtransferase [Candidatus Acetothermia bacterium]|nr:sulfurtransferase [Candidatus Acetothermia bacterium]